MTEDLKQTIDDWFWSREVCDDDYFNRFFNRVLENSLGRYNQLLRIQPDISQYDWLVQNYKEAERLTTASGTSSKSNTVSRETDSTDTGTNGNTRTLNTRDVTDRDGTADDIHGGTLTKETTYGRTSTNSGTLKNAGDRTESGSITDSGTNSSTSDQKSLGKNSPQSISYSGSGMPGTLDWSYPGSQGENATTSSGTDSNTRTFNNHKTEDDFTQTDTRANALGGKDTVLDTDARTLRRTTTDDIDVAHTGTIQDAGTTSVRKTGTDSTESEETATSGNSGTDRLIETGRNVDIATLLNNAKQFIITTSAWTWLREQLEVCFLGIYEW